MSKAVFYFVSCSLLLAISWLAFFSGTKTSAQTKSCSAAITVTRNESDSKINGATATAFNQETKKSYKSVLQDEMPFFENLPEGEYRVTVTKPGYHRSADDFTLYCTENADNNWSIELYKGNSQMIVKLYNRPKPVLRRDSAKFVIGDSNIVQGRTDVNTSVAEEDEPGLVPPPPPKPTPRPVPKVIAGGVVNGKAISLVKPEYPAAARAVRAEGAVNVQVTIDEAGNVISASAVSGHPLLRAAAVQAARASKFSPTRLAGQPVKVSGVIVYNFVLPEPKKKPQ